MTLHAFVAICKSCRPERSKTCFAIGYTKVPPQMRNVMEAILCWTPTK